MPFDEGYELIKYATEKEYDDKLFMRWIADYQTATTFIEFKNKVRQSAGFAEQSAEEILAGVEDMMNKFKV